MDWSHLFSANEGLTRTAAIAAFGAGSLYVIYNLLDSYITSTPPPPAAGPSTEVERALTPQTRDRSLSSSSRKGGGGGAAEAPLRPLSVERSIEIVRQFTDPTDSPAQDGESSFEEAQKHIEQQTEHLTELLENLKYNGARVVDGDEVDSLGFLLTANDESILCETLGIVANCGAFKANQDEFREHGLLNQVKRLARHDNDAVKVQALNATVNLCVNDANQAEFADDIPYYLELAFREDAAMISLIALCVLCNLTVKHGSDPEVLKHTKLLASKAVCAASDQSLQAMKILVNVSCEEAGAEHLVETDLREDFFDLIRSEPAISQRCLTIVANLIPKIIEGSRLENRMIQLKGDMLEMWRKNDLEDAQKDQLKRALRALSVRGWGRLSESTMDLINNKQ